MFKPSKTTINMASSRGLKADVVMKAGISLFVVTDSENNPVFQYSVKEEMLSDPVQFSGFDVLRRGIPVVILSDSDLREVIKSWPLLSGKSDD